VKQAKKKMGRPPGRTQDRPMQLRVNADFLAMLDNWRSRQPNEISRTEAIRHLVSLAIAVECTARKGKK
jgi:hypothetical protein